MHSMILILKKLYLCGEDWWHVHQNIDWVYLCVILNNSYFLPYSFSIFCKFSIIKI